MTDQTGPSAEDMGLTKEEIKTPEQQEADLAVSAEMALSKYPFTEDDRGHYEQIAAKISTEIFELAEASGLEIPTESIREIKATLDGIANIEGFAQLSFNDDVIAMIRGHEGSAGELYLKMAEMARPFNERGKKKPPSDATIADLIPKLKHLAELGKDPNQIEALSNYNHLMKKLVEAHMNPPEGSERKEMRIDNMGEILDGIVVTLIGSSVEVSEVVEATTITAEDVLSIFRESKMKVPKSWDKASVEFKRDIWFAMHSVARSHSEFATVYETETGPVLSVALAKQKE